jgi:SAM-dependent methyltransferase
LAGSIDNCNFASDTIWAKGLTAGKIFRFSSRKPPGTQYIVDAASLPSDLDGHYDLVFSSHMLEHTANPLRALYAWHRVLRPGGSLVLVIPDKHWTFDHLRPITEMQHIDDFEADRGEDDLTHVPEILRLHDLSRNWPVTREQLEDWAWRNPEIRHMHHHVFDTGLVRQILEYCGFAVKKLTEQFPWHVVALARSASR